LFYNAVIERDQKSPSNFEGVILRSKIGVVYIRYNFARMKKIKNITINYTTIPTRYICSLPYNELLKEKAKKLRRNSTFSEVLFWMQVNNKKFYRLILTDKKL